ncbi:MAG TPA: AI-2E family transporter [Polyangiaceae bacterium]|nr:AI-2E family transporter [Polyangiaceae bacterium]
MQSSLPLPKDVRWRRLLGVALFLAVLFFFRKLAPVLICFVIFERALGFCSDQIAKRTKLHRKGVVGGLLALLAGGLGVGAFFGAQRLVPVIKTIKNDGGSYVDSIADSGLLEKIKDKAGIDSEALTHGAKEYALQAFGYVTATAYVALFFFVGFILAVMYLFEREDIDHWWDGVDAGSIVGTLMRWLGYVADSIAITVRLQVVVAIFNAIFTLPLILFLGLPKPGLLFALVLVSGMVPVVGGLFSGIVLCLVSYDAKGVVGVGVFLGVTFVLSKVESYYLTPRLTAQHVKLPGVVLVISLLMFETLFGFWGLFLSFPALYVASRIVHEWREEEREIREAGGTLSMPPPSVPEPTAPPDDTG